MVLPLVSCWWWSCCFCLAEDTTTNHRQAPQRWAAAGDESATAWMIGHPCPSLTYHQMPQMLMLKQYSLHWIAKITLSSEMILKLWLLSKLPQIVSNPLSILYGILWTSLGGILCGIHCGIPRTDLGFLGGILCGILCGIPRTDLGSVQLVMGPMWLVTHMWGFARNFLCPSFQGIYCPLQLAPPIQGIYCPLQLAPPTWRFLEICGSFVLRVLMDGSVVRFVAWLSVWHVHQHTPAMKQQSWLVGSSIS